jgi:hypothetical protein
MTEELPLLLFRVRTRLPRSLRGVTTQCGGSCCALKSSLVCAANNIGGVSDFNENWNLCSTPTSGAKSSFLTTDFIADLVYAKFVERISCQNILL